MRLKEFEWLGVKLKQDHLDLYTQFDASKARDILMAQQYGMILLDDEGVFCGDRDGHYHHIPRLKSLPSPEVSLALVRDVRSLAGPNQGTPFLMAGWHLGTDEALRREGLEHVNFSITSRNNSAYQVKYAFYHQGRLLER